MKINIYQNTAGEYYYSSKKEKKKDIKIDEDVSAEYAFNYCSKMNFNDKTISTSKKPTLSKNKNQSKSSQIWRKKNRARRNYLILAKQEKELKKQPHIKKTES